MLNLGLGPRGVVDTGAVSRAASDMAQILPCGYVTLRYMSVIKVASVLLFASILCGQGPSPGLYRSSLELLPNAATVVTDPHNVSVTRTSASVVSIGTSASATLPQSFRVVGPQSGQYYTRQFTSALTLTATVGGATGTIYIYAVPTTGSGTTAASFQVVVITGLGGTLTCTGAYTCTVVTRGSSLGTQARGSGIYLAAATMTAGSPATFDVSGVTIQTQNQNAWLRAMSFGNITGSAVTVTLADGRGVQYGTTLSIAANTTYEVEFAKPGYELFFERGLVVTVGTASAIDSVIRWILPALSYSPSQP